MATASEQVGRWQVMLLLLLGCNYLIVGINHTLATFQGYTPSFFCKVICGDERAQIYQLMLTLMFHFPPP
jgi:hypothetical protein